MVAMSGAIMPAPLAKPLIVTLALPMLVLAVASLGKVSVVVIALAATNHASPRAATTMPAMTLSKARAFSGSPITPVEARNTLAGAQPTAREVMSAVSRQASRPLLPVNALALPELTTSARGFAPFSRALHHSTGADGHFERVKTPAATVPG